MVFYFTYMGDMYGVVEETNDELVVELLDTGERERHSKDWFRKKLKDGDIDYGVDKNNLVYYKKT